MKDRVDAWIGGVLARWLDLVLRHARSVAVICLALTLVLGFVAARGLGVNSDNVELISKDLPFRQIRDAFARKFPILSNVLIVVIDAETPELARDAAGALSERLRARSERFHDVHSPGAGTFFERNALMYRSVEELEDFADHIARVQPIIAELERDPSIANLAQLVQRSLDRVQREGGDPAQWSRLLDDISRATVAVYEEQPVYVSWGSLLLEGSALELSTRQVLLVEPVLDFDSVLPAGRPLREIRDLARSLELDPGHGVTVRITGNPALNYEEMLGLFWDIAAAGVFCFLLVAAVLYRALRSLPVVISAIATLLVGLVWTAAFAATTVERLNIVSIAFAVLFIGLGVDFAVHLGMHYAHLRRIGRRHEAALHGAAESVGGSLVLCAVSTMIGFFAFVPTDYLGVAELGVIAGGGMAIILFLTLTFFPALLSSWLPVRDADRLADLNFRAAWSSTLHRFARLVLGAAAAIGVAALAASSQVRFDPNVVQLRDPDTESVQLFNELLRQRGNTSPWYVSVVAPDLEHAEELAPRLEAIPTVSHAVTLASYVPADQEDKREILADLDMMLALPAQAGEPARTSLEEQVEALRALHEFFDAPWVEANRSELGDSVRRLRDELGRFLLLLDEGDDPQASLSRLERELLGGVPAALERLRTALRPEPVALDDLPPRLVDRMIAGDGTARIQVFPRENLEAGDALEEFVDSVRAVAPEATGMAVDIVEFGHTTVDSLHQALAAALALIALLLWLLWRNPTDVALALAPLLLAAALTVASMTLLDIRFNFANVIVLPLLLGIGVDSGIHLVHRARTAPPGDWNLLGDTTARAVFYSALTTITSFGTLAFSSHRGVASLGIVLTIAIGFTLLCNLVVLPALLTVVRDLQSRRRT